MGLNGEYVFLKEMSHHKGSKGGHRTKAVRVPNCDLQYITSEESLHAISELEAIATCDCNQVDKAITMEYQLSDQGVNQLSGINHISEVQVTACDEHNDCNMPIN